ncbi:oxygen-independent coproporphyrinogen III oxidase [Helicobacter pametensis]|uniref:oxygen-independent coproporphyrinogen III oxidase n=1 Tax=Helicobacter pametensis TaxID=95149 RepID=UPI00048725CA|nr:oxygen-independent coproporphyrinogen III oxidase [Helicobacter pametensis]
MIDFDKIAKYSKSGPRYTSYPTAVEFHEGFQETDYIRALQASNQTDIPLSLYVHLPFCKSACYFCGCNVIYTSSEEKKQGYLPYIKKELELLARYLDTKREVIQLHFGGGTPTFFQAKHLEYVISLLHQAFPNFAPNIEASCEIDPRFFNAEQMKVLKEGGFNRVSFGVQDFNPIVQKAINRFQSVELVSNAVKIARDAGIKSINFDLISGLPYQNQKSFLETLDTVISLDPDRLAIFNYAHMPWIKKTMQMIPQEALPTPQEKIKILKSSIEFLKENGYELIGMDHFAKRDDELFLAMQNGELRRNFQGYTTRGFSQTIGIGVTSIGEGRDYYVQNQKDLKDYMASLDLEKLPVHKGIWLSSEDRLRKEVIMEIMNNMRLEYAKFDERFGIDCKSHFAQALEALKEYQEIGLLEMNEDGFWATPTGGMLIRNIAMEFDAYLPKITDQNRFSKTL